MGNCLPGLIAETELPSGKRLRLIHGDLTEARVDAIVNAANASLAHGGGLAAAIVRAGGGEIQDESNAWVRAHGEVRHDKPAITGAGKLPCRYVIHAVGPVWGEGDEDGKLRAAVLGALELAHERGLTSLGLPPISTGIFGFPLERGANVILEALDDFFSESLESPLGLVEVTMIDERSVQVFRRVFKQRWPESVRES